MGVRTMRKLISAVFLFIATITAAHSTILALKLKNISSEAINTITATPKDAAVPSTQNILVAPIPAGASGTTSITSDNGDCVFSLTFTSASGKIVVRPDVDICLTDTIIVE